MKKLIALLLAAVMCLSLAACSNGKAENTDHSQDRTRKIHRTRTSRQKQRRRETETPNAEELMGDYTRENYHAELGK